MRYLGQLAGRGRLRRGAGEEIAVAYEFDGFLRNGMVVASGEITTDAGLLDGFGGAADLRIVVEDGREFTVAIAKVGSGSVHALEITTRGLLAADWRSRSDAAA